MNIIRRDFRKQRFQIGFRRAREDDDNFLADERNFHDGVVLEFGAFREDARNAQGEAVAPFLNTNLHGGALFAD